MKKSNISKIFASAALMLCVGSAQAVVTELAVNGDFATGDATGWTFFANGGTIDYAAPGNGGFGGNMVAVGTPSNPTLKQANVGAGQLVAGQAVTVSFDWKGSNSDGGVVDVVLFSEQTGGGVSQTDAMLGGAPSSASWTSVGPTTFNIGPDVGGGVTLQFTVICGGAPSCTSDYSFDNISITADLPAVPVPAAAWLFGSALLGLGGIARKRKAA